MKNQILIASETDIDGTSFFQHTVTTTFKHLNNVLGTPEYLDDTKVQYQWCRKLVNENIVFTVYDWLEDRIKPNSVIEWHIGVHSEKDGKKVQQILKTLL